VAEERVMDFAGGDDKGGDEEDKYVTLFLVLSGCSNSYTDIAVFEEKNSLQLPVEKTSTHHQLKEHRPDK
jgi:hypothetical protein